MTNLIKYFNKEDSSDDKLLRIEINNQNGTTVADFYITCENRRILGVLGRERIPKTGSNLEKQLINEKKNYREV